MNASEWQTCNDAWRMLSALKGRVSERKLRLFACAACRRLWPLLTDERSRAAVEVSERYADGLASFEELYKAVIPAANASDAAAQAQRRGWNVAQTAAEAASTAQAGAERAARAACDGDLMREIFGNPFSPVTLDRSWLVESGGNVSALAIAFYEGRAPDTLPVLADALEEAGCTSVAILDHLRGPGRHARGCWVIDLILDKN